MAIMPPANQNLQVFDAMTFRVVDGVAEGDGLSFADELILDDIYILSARAKTSPLTLSVGSDDGFVVAKNSWLGRADNQVVMDSCITLMAPDGSTHEALVLVEVEAGGVEAIYLFPLATLEPNTRYRLVGVDRHAATARLAEVACVSFTKGTRISLASGMQVPIENLKVGDQVLTRDDGPQPIRWIGQATHRAIGTSAPILIAKGALHNENDLIVSPDHRVFVYQREDRLGVGRNEVLVKVRHLINGDTVRQQDGGFVDYFQLLFDEHQIIYAEGIAAESLLINQQNRSAMPEVAGKKTHDHRPHLDYEVTESVLSHPDAVALLRKASSS